LPVKEKRWALVWLGGAATGYEPVTYRLGGEAVESVLAAAALNKLLAGEAGGFEERLVLVPETLFEENRCGMYRLLLEAKTGYRDRRLKVSMGGELRDVTQPDRLTHELLEQGFGCVEVPHPGVASPLILEELLEEKGAYLARFGQQEIHERPFEAMLNTVYAALRALARKGYSLVVDLSHGTNPLVSATLLAASMIASVYGPAGVETRIYMAPVMGRVARGTEVEFIDVTGAAETVNTVASGINAWNMLDERLLPREAVVSTGSRIGRKYGPLYGSARRVVEKSAELLWALRSGQVPLIPDMLRGLAELEEKAAHGLEEMLRDPEALALDTPWAPVADAVAVSTRRLLERLLRERNVDTMIASVEELVDKDMPDRALGPARELVVALLAASQASPGTQLRIGGEEWEKAAKLIEMCARAGSGERPPECSKLPLTEEELAAYDRARKLRNRLMHGRLSKEENALLQVLEGNDIRVAAAGGKGKPGPLSLIGLKEAASTAAKLALLLRRLRGS